MSQPGQPHEAGSFGHEPGPRITADHVLHEELIRGRGGRCPRVDESGCQLRRADVLVSEPGQGCFPHACRFGVQEAFPGEGAQQVMQPVPDQSCRIDTGNIGQDRVHQLFEQLLGLIRVRFEEGGEVPRREIGGEQPQHPEGPLLGVVPAAVTQAERGTDLKVAGFEQVQAPVLIAEPVREPGDLPGRTGRQPGSGDAERQRQVPAEPGDVTDRLRLRMCAGRADDGRQQFGGLAGRHQVQRDGRRAGQRSHPGRTGYQHRASGAPRQQRTDLRLVGGVVEHDEHAPARQLRPVHAGSFIEALGDAGSVDAELAEETGQDIGRILPSRVRLPEVGVGERLPVPVW